jgi:hypothetical protein
LNDTSYRSPFQAHLWIRKYSIKEAARVLRKKSKTTQEIVPFTLAAIKWRLGKRGMI